MSYSNSSAQPYPKMNYSKPQYFVPINTNSNTFTYGYNFVFDSENNTIQNSEANSESKSNSNSNSNSNANINLSDKSNLIDIGFIQYINNVISITTWLFVGVLCMSWFIGKIVELNKLSYIGFGLFGLIINIVCGFTCYKYSLDDSIQTDVPSITQNNFFAIGQIPIEKKIILGLCVIGMGLTHSITMCELDLISKIMPIQMILSMAISGWLLMPYLFKQIDITKTLDMSIQTYANTFISVNTKAQICFGLGIGFIDMLFHIILYDHNLTHAFLYELVCFVFNLILILFYNIQIKSNITDCEDSYNPSFPFSVDITKCALMNLLRFYSFLFNVYNKLAK